MIFNPCCKDFMPELVLGGFHLEVVEEMRLLGLIVTPDLKWTANTENIVKRAYSKLWMLRRLRSLGANNDQLIDVYLKQVRSLLEQAVPAWNKANLQMLSIRREQLGLNFARKAEKNPKHKEWFKPTMPSKTRQSQKTCVIL